MFRRRKNHIEHEDGIDSLYIEQLIDPVVGKTKQFWPPGQIAVRRMRSTAKQIAVKVRSWRSERDANGKRRLGAVTRKEVPPHLYINLRDPNRRKTWLELRMEALKQRKKIGRSMARTSIGALAR